MFNYDWEYLIHLLYCFVQDEQPEEKSDNISFKNVYELGKVHEVSNIAFLSVEKLKGKPEAELYNEWKINYYFSFERDAKQLEEYNRVISLLHENKIRTLEAQGTVTKTFYPSPELRMMSDIDLIIDKENVEKAISLFGEGYRITREKEDEFNVFNEQDIEIEFHNEFFTKTMYNRKERFYEAVNHPFEHAYQSDSDEYKFILEDDYFYLYSLLHTIKHFETAGCGIRRILDLYYLKKEYDGRIDSEFIKSVIDENGFTDSYEKLFALEEEWFEGKKSGLDLSEAKKDVLTSGNHGILEIYTRNTIRRDKAEKKRFVKLKRLIRFIFPKKEYVYLAFPQARENNYSTVRCWLLRAGSTLKRFDFSHFIGYIKSVIESK